MKSLSLVWIKRILGNARGDVLIAVTDGLKGLPDALEAVVPQTTLRTCIVHLIRNSMDYAGWKDRRPFSLRRTCLSGTGHTFGSEYLSDSADGLVRPVSAATTAESWILDSRHGPGVNVAEFSERDRPALGLGLPRTCLM